MERNLHGRTNGQAKHKPTAIPLQKNHNEQQRGPKQPDTSSRIEPATRGGLGWGFLNPLSWLASRGWADLPV